MKMTAASGRPGASLIELLVVIAIISVVIAMTLVGVQKARASAARLACQNQLRQLSLALHQYAHAHRIFPPACNGDDPKHPQPYMSWHVRILPHLEQSKLYDDAVAAFRADRDFRRLPPHTLATQAFVPFGCPADARTLSPQKLAGMTRGLTSYLGVNGTRAGREDGALYLDSAVPPSGVTDGLSNTLLIGERPPSTDMVFGWWYAGWGQDKDGEGDLHLGVRTRNNDRRSPACPIGPHEYRPGRPGDQCDFLHFWSLHSGGANFAFADGSVRFLGYPANDLLPALATRAAGDTAPALD